jgi:DNA (cytosine-5)-methyltransferase 1
MFDRAERMPGNTPIPVIDIFAGPGGLGEGFSAFSCRGAQPFKIALSVEKDANAHKTLRLRSFFRQFQSDKVPELYYDVLRRELKLEELPERLNARSDDLFAKWHAADSEAMQAELGASEETHAEISRRIVEAIGGKNRPWVLIGGPPCQAYSIVGRVRNLGKADYRIEDDRRSSLYQEYLRIIAEHQPTVFVMENVKGMLSATVENQKVFDKILSDLTTPPLAVNRKGKQLRYRVESIVEQARPRRDGISIPTDFVVECEKFGVPQQRHRVILIGVREDLGDIEVPRLKPHKPPTVQQTIGDLPKLRSGVSRKRQGDHYVPLEDSGDLWMATIRDLSLRDGEERRWVQKLCRESDQGLYQLVVSTVEKLRVPKAERGSDFVPLDASPATADLLTDWLVDPRLKGVCNHESRRHLDSDLARYLFAACHAKIHKTSPKLDAFPPDLLPSHKNAKDEELIFDDRFRVQLAGSTATTVTSHLSKDGHYFIHYDPSQCRSMTVREVARLQTFPDNYLFCGPRTAQYVQVGNAVPPWVAQQIAECVWQVLVNADKV